MVIRKFNAPAPHPSLHSHPVPGREAPPGHQLPGRRLRTSCGRDGRQFSEKGGHPLHIQVAEDLFLLAREGHPFSFAMKKGLALPKPVD